MECREVRQLAEAYVSEQVLVETAEAIGAHLARCPSCRAEIEGLRRLRAGVRAAVLHAPALAMRPGFAQALGQRLQAEAAAENGPATQGVPGGPGAPHAPGLSAASDPGRFSRRGWLTLAASTLVALGLGFGWQRRSAATLAALANDAAGDHQNCAITFRLSEEPMPLPEAARRFGGIFGPLDQVAPPATLSGGAVTVEDRHACVFNGRRFAHVVMRYRNSTTSLLVPADPRPAWQRWAPRAASGQLAELGVGGSYNMASFTSGRHVAFVVSNLPAADVQEVAQALTGPVTAALTGG